jgi:hypothetical protein
MNEERTGKCLRQVIWLSTLNLISTFSFLSVDTSDGGLLIPGDIIRPVVGASAHARFIQLNIFHVVVFFFIFLTYPLGLPLIN